MNKSKKCMIDGSPVTKDHQEINVDTGLQKGYVVVCEEERDKARAEGFTRPVRQTYVHVGLKLPDNLRALTPEEHEQYDKYDYAMYEEYDESRSPVVGKFYTRAELRGGCGGETTMHIALAETYAINPKFYRGTFCSNCAKHFPVGEFIWKGTNERVGD